jgi:hypothetical protein
MWSGYLDKKCEILIYFYFSIDIFNGIEFSIPS